MPTAVIVAEDSIEIARLGALKAEWLSSSAQANAVEIDLGEVQRIDTAGLQFLLAFRLEATAMKQSLKFKNVSAATRKAADQLGLASALFQEG
ncbi:MAG: STAS domain-containing protein [Acidobacteria bacterium]|nr:STAS domain-containing protein [Acidobacteriota bacterium]